METRKESKIFSSVGFIFALLAGITIVVQLILIWVLDQLAPNFSNSSCYIWIISMAPLYLVAVPTCLCLSKGIESKKIEEKKLGFGKIGRASCSERVLRLV